MSISLKVKAFDVSIRDTERQTLWFRAVYYLSTISEEICLTISDSFIIASAVNSAYTSSCKVTFERKFFDSFEYNPHEIVFGESGLQVAKDAIGESKKLYSLLINGKHLTTISKVSSDSGPVNEFKIAIDNTISCPEALANRLLVSIEMESLVQKEYSPQFTPTQYNPILVDLKYKRKFLDVFGTTETRSTSNSPIDPKLREICRNIEQELSKELFTDAITSENRDRNAMMEEINYICCNQSLLRNFVDNCNTSLTDEIQLQLDTRRLILTAFTKAIYGKGNDILKSAISMSNTIALTTLEHCSIFWVEDKEMSGRKPMAKTIVFKSKEFKNFVAMNTSSRQHDYSTGCINIWFCNPGDPILMEHKKGNVKFELLQVTDSYSQDNLPKVIAEGINTNSESPNKYSVSPLRMSAIKSTSNMNIKKEPRNTPLSKVYNMSSGYKDMSDGKPSPTRRLFVADDDMSEGELQSENQSVIERNSKETAFNVIPVHGFSNSHLDKDVGIALNERTEATRNATIIGWGSNTDMSEVTTNNANSGIDLFKKEKRKIYEQEGSQSKKAKGESQFGPTQTELPKGLLD
ncbi:uncharacterized protein GVI51_G09031 [Nakaseomyces glabratus]|uniref:DNA damage checkpoint protein 1 n=2 Tax=Candida glabrata TaxID=5478 RepID=Q6FSN3_CANGA|nr:uncharacterized protein CAGL0G09196g [Nakaseomyces glabratus]KAH7587064.1 Rad9 [Nakaseomyces glabratus]KAH7602514.1 Rad9 [Nakaseomyces glabratus]KAH7603516.1 Rad9 [Nakaseomyces glabratus]KAH7607039.1 Rad9 [Nakaseomyces glabratus]KAH7613904.1 Rad9 [Nakaseomyces glabratus]|eukprot:XP_446761.1 uncharacterized protein CAGL0G09196g [[Candida] glabrata]